MQICMKPKCRSFHNMYFYEFKKFSNIKSFNTVAVFLKIKTGQGS